MKTLFFLLITTLLFSCLTTAESDPLSIESYTKNFFEYNYESEKYPVKLKWSAVTGADFYEIEITNNTREHKRYFKRLDNRMYIMIFPNESYLWRVLAYDSNKNIIGRYSKSFSLKVNVDGDPSEAPDVVEEDPVETDTSGYETINTPEEPVEYDSNDDLPDDLYDSSNDDARADPEADNIEDTMENTAEAVPAKPQGPRDFWLHFGVGFNLPNYTQKHEGIAEFTHDTAQVSFNGQFGYYIKDQWAVAMSALISPDKFDEENDFFNSNFTWKDLSIEGLYSFSPIKENTWYLRFGLNYLSAPLVVVFPTTTTIDLTENVHISPSIGVGYKAKFNEKIHYNAYVTAQMPLSSDIDDYQYEYDSGFILNASAEAKYYIKDNMNFGVNWSLKYLSTEFELENSQEIVPGEQTLINNNVHVFFGVDF